MLCLAATTTAAVTGLLISIKQFIKSQSPVVIASS